MGAAGRPDSWVAPHTGAWISKESGPKGPGFGISPEGMMCRFSADKIRNPNLEIRNKLVTFISVGTHQILPLLILPGVHGPGEASLLGPVLIKDVKDQGGCY